MKRNMAMIFTGVRHFSSLARLRKWKSPRHWRTPKRAVRNFHITRCVLEVRLRFRYHANDAKGCTRFERVLVKVPDTALATPYDRTSRISSASARH